MHERLFEPPATPGVLKAIVVRQPWASLIVAGIKDVENRSWSTEYRGRLAIQSSARPNSIDFAALRKHRRRLGIRHWQELPLGQLIGAVDLVGIRDDSSSEWAIEGQLHWELVNAQRLAQPVPHRGCLGLFELDDDLAASFS